MLGIKKITQHTTSKVYSFIPIQDFDSSTNNYWKKSIKEIDSELYAKYGLTEEEINYINDTVGVTIEVE